MSEQSRYSCLQLARTQGWVEVTLNRPQARNAMSDAMVGDLIALADELGRDPGVRGVSFRGAEGFFCAGGDLKGFQALSQGGDAAIADAIAASRRIGDMLEALDRLPAVTIMLVEGAAMAGGLGLMCTGDLVIATRNAKFALTETTLGIPPAQIAPYIIARTGMRTARRLMLTAERFDGEAAAAFGLVDMLVDDADQLAEAATQVGQQVLKCAPGANRATKAFCAELAGLNKSDIVARAGEVFADCLKGEEAREGIAAFFDKRPPAWRS